MGEAAFDIYQTDAGYAAITNPVQRQILEALRERERQLPELVELTGRSKPTLSSLHMKELLARELIEEAPHPTDSRRKVYRLRAQKIGSSDLPVAQLKQAIQHYVTLAPLSGRLPVATALEALAAAPAGTPEAVLQAQAGRLGALCAALFKAGTPRDLWMRLSSFLEAERLATILRIDLQHGAMELRPGPAAPMAPARLATLLAGFLEGVATDKGIGVGKVTGTSSGEVVRLAAHPSA